MEDCCRSGKKVIEGESRAGEWTRSVSEAIESNHRTGESLLAERTGLWLFESESDEEEGSSWLINPTCWRSPESQSSKREVEISVEPKTGSKLPKSSKPCLERLAFFLSRGRQRQAKEE